VGTNREAVLAGWQFDDALRMHFVASGGLGIEMKARVMPA